MIREEKIVSIAILTVLMYALGLFFDAHFFLLPFPLFDLIFFIVFIQFLIWNRKSIQGYVLLFFAFSMVQVMYNPLVLGSLGSDIQLQKLDESLCVDVAKLMAKLLLISAVFLWKYQRRLDFSILYIFLFIGISLLGLIGPLFWLTPFAPLLLFFVFWRADIDNRFRYLWILQGVFDLFTVSMLLFT